MIVAIFALEAKAFDMRNPKVHCSRDTIKINEILLNLKEGDDNIGARMVKAATLLQGSGPDEYYEKDSVADLRLNVESFTPLTFVNNVIALAKASEQHGFSDWRTFASEFENISCRKGEFTGYPSIMYHTSDWIIDNTARGNLRELTEDYSGGVVPRTKSLDQMTRHRSDFAALADSANYESVRMMELGFRTHRIPTLKKETIKKKEILDDLRQGDILIMVPGKEGIDCYDIGIINIKEDGPHLIHLSPAAGQVIEEEETLMRYMPLVTKNFQGYRLIRVTD